MSEDERNPKVSVVIPCYNREDFVARTLDSALAQTYPNIDVIVVDDGSTDSTRDILESYGSRITVLEHPGRVNKGQSAAINVGLRKADGEYVAILDSDDLWAPEKIEKQVRFLEAHPEVGLVYGNGYAIDESERKLYRMYDSSHREESNPERVLIDCYFLLPNNALLRRSIFEITGGFDEHLRAAQDHDMAIRVAEVAKLAFIDEEVFYYRRHKDSISHKRASVRWVNGFTILDKAVKRYPYSAAARRKRRAVLHFRLGQCMLEERKFLPAAVRFLSAACLDPVRSLQVLFGRERISSQH